MRRLRRGLRRLLFILVLLLLATLAACRWQASTRETRTRHDAAPSTGRFVRAHDVDVFIQERGPADGRSCSSCTAWARGARSGGRRWPRSPARASARSRSTCRRSATRSGRRATVVRPPGASPSHHRPARCSRRRARLSRRTLLRRWPDDGGRASGTGARRGARARGRGDRPRRANGRRRPARDDSRRPACSRRGGLRDGHQSTTYRLSARPVRRRPVGGDRCARADAAGPAGAVRRHVGLRRLASRFHDLRRTAAEPGSGGLSRVVAAVADHLGRSRYDDAAGAGRTAEDAHSPAPSSR